MAAVVEISKKTESTTSDAVEFYSKAQQFAGTSDGIERVRKFMQFVHDEIRYDPTAGTTWTFKLPVKAAIRERHGACEHQAEILHQILSKEAAYTVDDISATMVLSDYILFGFHAMLSVKYNGEKYVVDPTNMVLERYDKLTIKTNPAVPFGVAWDIFKDGIVFSNLPAQVKEAADRLKPYAEKALLKDKELNDSLSDLAKIARAFDELCEADINWILRSKEEIDKLNLMCANAVRPS